MVIKEVAVNSYMTSSKLPDADFVINPYVGCPHKCIYCYAEFMKRFTGHGGEEWGDFVDVKICDKPINLASIPSTSTVLIGSVTDAYNALDRKYGITRKIVEQLISCEARVEVLTKSDLVTRDIDYFRQIKKCYIGVSMNTMNDEFRKRIEPHASSIKKRIEALKKLHREGIHTYLFMSPIFPKLSECTDIIDAVSPFVDYVCFENLNLHGAYLPRVMTFIQENYPEYEELFKTIYWNKNMSYWEELKKELEDYCSKKEIEHRFYFYHDQMKKK